MWPHVSANQAFDVSAKRPLRWFYYEGEKSSYFLPLPPPTTKTVYIHSNRALKRLTAAEVVISFSEERWHLLVVALFNQDKITEAFLRSVINGWLRDKWEWNSVRLRQHSGTVSNRVFPLVCGGRLHALVLITCVSAVQRCGGASPRQAADRDLSGSRAQAHQPIRCPSPPLSSRDKSVFTNSLCSAHNTFSAFSCGLESSFTFVPLFQHWDISLNSSWPAVSQVLLNYRWHLSFPATALSHWKIYTGELLLLWRESDWKSKCVCLRVSRWTTHSMVQWKSTCTEPAHLNWLWPLMAPSPHSGKTPPHTTVDLWWQAPAPPPLPPGSGVV